MEYKGPSPDRNSGYVCFTLSTALCSKDLHKQTKKGAPVLNPLRSVTLTLVTCKITDA